MDGDVMLNKDQKWKKKEDGTMELIEEVEVERELPEPTKTEILELNMYEAVAEVYEEQLIAQLDTYEAIAEMYELFFVGGEM
jgi:cobalamin biosynthesis protein CbiD